MLEITTEKVIEASIPEVWKVLTNFSEYQHWNSFMPKISGKFIEGEKLTVHIVPPEGKPDQFTATLVKVDDLKEFRWVGSFIAPWLVRGEHYFQLTRISNQRTLLTQGEIFTGLLIPLVAKKLNGNVRKGFENMNNDLARRCLLIKQGV